MGFLRISIGEEDTPERQVRQSWSNHAPQGQV